MELFTMIVNNTEKQLVIVIKKKTDKSKNTTLTVVCQQDELAPFSFRGTAEQLDAEFEASYNSACQRFKDIKPPDKIESNVEEVAAEEEKEAKEEAKAETKRQDSKKKAGDAKKPDKAKEIKDKIDKLKKGDKEKLTKIMNSIKVSKDPDVVKFSQAECQRFMKSLQFSEEDIKYVVDTMCKSNTPAAKKEETKEDTGMFGDAEILDVEQEEESKEEAPWEGEDSEQEAKLESIPEVKSETKPEPKVETKPAPKKAAPKKAEAPKQEEVVKQPEPVKQTQPIQDEDDEDALLF